MSNLEVVGSLLLYAVLPPTVSGSDRDSASAVKQIVKQAEGEGYVVVDIIPIYEGAYTAVTAVFLKVAGSTRNRS